MTQKMWLGQSMAVRGGEVGRTLFDEWTGSWFGCRFSNNSCKFRPHQQVTLASQTKSFLILLFPYWMHIAFSSRSVSYETDGMYVKHAGVGKLNSCCPLEVAEDWCQGLLDPEQLPLYKDCGWGRKGTQAKKSKLRLLPPTCLSFVPSWVFHLSLFTSLTLLAHKHF